MEELKEKDKKFKDLKNQKEKLTQQRIETSIEMQKQKEDIIQKFDILTKKNKEIDPETIKQIFPDDEELYNKVVEMKKKQKEKEELLKKKLEEQSNIKISKEEEETEKKMSEEKNNNNKPKEEEETEKKMSEEQNDNNNNKQE